MSTKVHCRCYASLLEFNISLVISTASLLVLSLWVERLQKLAWRYLFGFFPQNDRQFNILIQIIECFLLAVIWLCTRLNAFFSQSVYKSTFFKRVNKQYSMPLVNDSVYTINEQLSFKFALKQC